MIQELGYEPTVGELSAQCRAYLDSEHSTVFVSETDGRLSGMIAGHAFALFHQPGNIGRITALVVSAAVRGKGMGGLLLERMEGWFRNRRCLRFEVTSADHRNMAHRFYRSRGYERDGLRFTNRST